ncbi:tetratricopeptide repeat protein [Desulfosarcina variabilis str. Montpellier]
MNTRYRYHFNIINTNLLFFPIDASRMTLVLLIINLLLLLHGHAACYASPNEGIYYGNVEMDASIFHGDIKDAINVPASILYWQYRQRVKEITPPDHYWKEIWRSRRSYPYAQRAIDLCHEHKFAEAISIYDTYLEKDPGHLLMQWDRLVLLDVMKNSQRIEIAATEFLSHAPGFGPVLILRALARKDLKHNMQAETDWKTALEGSGLTDNDRWRAMAEMMFSTYQRKAYAASLKWCEQLMQSKPPTIADMIFRAGLLEKLQQWQAAYTQWQIVMDSQPGINEHRQAILAGAVLLQKMQDEKAAFQLLSDTQNKALFDQPGTPEPDHESYYLQRAQLAQRLGYVDLAIQCYEKLGANNLNDDRRLSLARLYAKSKQHDKIMPLLFAPRQVTLDHTQALQQMLDLIHDLAGQKAFQLASTLLEQSFPLARDNYQRNKHDQSSRSMWVYYLATRSTLTGSGNGQQQKESSLAQLAILTGDFQHQMAYAVFLASHEKPHEAIEIFNLTVERSDLSFKQRSKAYAALAAAFGQTGQFTKEALAWNQAYRYEDTPMYRLYEIQAWKKAGNFQAIEKIIHNFPVQRLSAKHQVSWYETTAHTWREMGELNKSKMAWQKASEIQPRAFYHCQISDILVAQGDLKGAETHTERVFQIWPQNPRIIKRLAYINIQLGNNEKATMLFERLKKNGWDSYETSADLGFAYARMGENELAYQNLVNGVDKVLSDGNGDPRKNAQQQSVLASMRSQIAEIDRRFEFLIADSFYSLNDEDGVLKLPSSSQWFNMGIGMVELGFRPPRIGYDAGRILTLFGRVMWPNRSDSIRPEKDTLQAGLGVKYKPLKQTNVILSAEQIFGLGDEIDDHLLLRIAHSATHMPSKHSHAKDGPSILDYLSYRQVYTDIGKAFDNDDSWFISHETRLGNDLSGKDNRFYLLFGYLQGNAILSSDEDFAQIQTGIGFSWQRLGGLDHYRGYQREAELLFRLGYVVYEDNDNLGLSTLLGLRLSFF